ncbi:MAG: 4a-hydroxytetrahydrobiopterin dehydratase [Thermoprotei archaeon]
MVKLDSEAIGKRLSKLGGWRLEGNSLVRELEFDDFDSAIDFIVKLAPIANKLDHHPDIYNSYNKVRLSLTTHEEGGVTEKDFELAEQIDLLLKRGG